MPLSVYLLFVLAIVHKPHEYYRYVLAEPFFYPGGCDSAAQLDPHIALACRAGIWLGPPENLHLSLSCLASEDQPNRIRALDNRSFIAATPCGLYRIFRSGDHERIPSPAEPPGGVLDSDGKGRVVVAADGWLWLWSTQDPAWRRFGPEAQDEPQRIELVDGHVLRAGQSTDVVGLADGQSELSLEDSLFHALVAGGRLLSADESGRYWMRTSAQTEGDNRSLDLAPHEQLRAVLGWGSRVVVFTTARMLVVDEETIIEGRLPRSTGDWVPVRSDDAIPWLIGPGGVYRPTPTAPRTSDEAPAAIMDRALLYRPRLFPKPPTSIAARLLPRIECRASGTHLNTHFYRSDTHRFDRRSETLFGGWLTVAWDLPNTRYQTFLSEQESLRRELRQVETERIASLSKLFADWFDPLDPDAGDGLTREEFEAYFEILTNDP